MAKVFTDIQLDKPRKMRFGLAAVRKMERNEATMNRMSGSETDMSLVLAWIALLEDDSTLTFEQFEEMVDELGLTTIGLIKVKLYETLKRDAPHMLPPDIQEEVAGEEGNLPVLPETVNPE